MFNEKSASLIRAKWSGKTFNRKKFSRGETVIMFPRGIYVGVDEKTGEKVFRNTYLRPEDIGNYPQLRDLHTRLNRKHGCEISKIITAKR
jgi:hypothetical protein